MKRTDFTQRTDSTHQPGVAGEFQAAG